MTVAQAIEQAGKNENTFLRLTDAVVDCENSHPYVIDRIKTFDREVRPVLISNPEQTHFILGIYEYYFDGTPVRFGNDDPPIPCSQKERGLTQPVVQGTMIRFGGKHSVYNRLMVDGLYLGKKIEFQLMGNEGFELVYVNIFISSGLFLFFLSVIIILGKKGDVLNQKFKKKKK